MSVNPKLVLVDSSVGMQGMSNIGIGVGRMESMIPNMELQNNQNLYNDLPKYVKVNTLNAKAPLKAKDSNYKDVTEFHSVGGMRLSNNNIEKIVAKNEIPDVGVNNVDKPKREGKNDDAGKSVPNKPGGRVPNVRAKMKKPKDTKKINKKNKIVKNAGKEEEKGKEKIKK